MSASASHDPATLAPAGGAPGIRPPEGTRRARLQSAAESALVVAGVLLHLVVYPHAIFGDGAVRWQTTLALARGELTPFPYPLLQSLLTLPLVPLGPRVAAYFSELVLLGGMLALALLLRAELGARLLRRFALLVLCASMFGHSVQAYYGETLTAVALAVALAAAARDRRRIAAVGAVVAILNTPAAAPAALAGLLVALRRRRLAFPVAVVAVAGALVLLENWARRGSPLLSGYEGDHGFATFMPFSGRPGFSYPLLLGAASLAFSFGKGILFFAPGLWLYLRREWRRPEPPLLGGVLGAWLVASLVLLLTYAKWWSWYGGWFWGPRFLLFASLPASLLLAHALGDRESPRLARMGVLAVLALSAWVGVSGAVFGQGGLSLCEQNDYQVEVLCWYVPEFSPLVRPFLDAHVFPPGAWAIFAHAALSAAVLAWSLVPERATGAEARPPPA